MQCTINARVAYLFQVLFQGWLNGEGGLLEGVGSLMLHNVDYQDTTGYVTFIQVFI
jgi:hypothetical protein